MSDADYRRDCYLPDLHSPYHDERAVALACAFLRRFKPHRVVLLGDAIDFYQLSRFEKNPARVGELQGDLDATHALLRRIQRAAPQAEWWLLRGNHEDRLRRWLWTDGAKAAKLRCLQLPELLQLRALGIRWVEAGQVRMGDFLVKHGHIVRARSGYTATGEMDRAGLSGVSAHTHRMGQVVRRTMAGAVTWLEAGCLCDLEPEYLLGNVADWAHGLVYGYHKRGARRFVTHLLPFIAGKVVFEGKEIAA